MTTGLVAAAAAAASIVSVGCKTTPVVVSPLPDLEPVEYERDFNLKTERVSFRVRPRPEAAKFTQTIQHPIEFGDSVVIYAPLDTVAIPMGRFGQPAPEAEARFRRLVQEVRSALIGQGFDVIDDAKFEAKLQAQGALEDGVLDLPDLLNAARDGEVVADFILRINQLSATPGRTRAIDPMGDRRVVAFSERHEGLADSGALDEVEAGIVEAVFNADLLRVEGGNVVWTGSHRVSSLDLPRIDTEVTITVTPKPNNLDDVTDDVRDFEDRLRSKHAAAALKRRQLLASERRLPQRDRDRLTADYERLLEEYRLMRLEAPRIDPTRLTFDYDYTISIRPDILGTFGGTPLEPDAMLDHELQLVRLAASDAFEQMDVRNR